MDLDILCWPTTPLKVPTQWFIKRSDLKKYKPYSAKTHCDRKTKSSVVPAPIPLGSEVTITDFRFSKHSEILATTISPSAK